MNAQQLKSAAEDLADNGYLKLVSRVAIAIGFPIAVGFLSWLGIAMLNVITQQAVITNRMDALAERIAADMRDRYTSSDATRDQNLALQRYNEQDRRLTENENAIKENRTRIRALETHRAGGPR